MGAIVCHGLQSYLESQLVESRIHRLRLPSPKPLTPPQQPIDLAFKSCFWESNTKPHCEENSYKTDTTTVHHNPNQGGWSSIQALSSVSQGPTYVVHPQMLRLSPKSLELCTENLGNETGSDMIESDIELLSSSQCGGGTREQTRKSGQVLGARNFPPPLTTIRGSECIRVRSHREGGRLVLEVTKVPSCFQAQRSHGRLRLCLWTDPEQDEEEFEGESNGQREDVEQEEEEEEGEWEETKGGNSWSVEGGVRMEKYERASRCRCRCRCKQSDHENNEMLINWGEPLCVATS